MDSLTHLLVGHAMGAVATSMAPPAGAAVYWAALIGNSLPDIDVPVSLAMRRGVKMHRTITHTIPGVIGLAAVTALVLSWIFPEAPVSTVFTWALLGNLAHLGLDCLNLFGVKPFWPFTARLVEFGVLHILDPYLLVILGIPTLGAALGMTSKAVLVLGFGLMWPYIVYRFAIARRLVRKLKDEGNERVRVIPWFTSWRYVFETASTIEFGYWRKGERYVVTTFHKEDSPLVRATMENPQVVSFLRSAEYPYALVEEDEEGASVVWKDMLRQLRADFRPLRVRVQPE
jgi:inner membrane protein